MAQASDAVYATLLMTDSYLPGAMVLGHSLRDRGAKAKLVACVLMDKLSLDTISELQTVFNDIVPVQQIVNMQPANLYLMNRPDLISTFTKVELWKQTQYKRIVYLDADMVVLRAPNELLNMETSFAAVPDVGWPDCFNSGMMVLNPNMGDYYSLLALAHRGISFDGADQGLLNMHFTDWERLSFTYNCTPSANYQYVPAYKHFQSSINIIHFIGADKPWAQGRDYKLNSGVYGELLARWWTVYDRHYRQAKYNQYVQPRSRVQDYVKGEETRYEPSYSQQSNPQTTNTGYRITQPQPQPPPGIHVSAPREDSSSMERPFGDQPSLVERIDEGGFKPPSTREQRRWSAPHAEWEPARQPPPQNAKPEAANFPSQQYDFNESTQLFEPPQSYPEPPKDMWYEVPKEKPQPSAPSKTIFPWEERAPKATRVFPKSREPTPSPPEPIEEQAEGQIPDSFPEDQSNTQQQASQLRQSSFSKTISQALSQPAAAARAPSPPRHVFPWESRAPKATRVFPQDKPPSPPAPTRQATKDGFSGSLTGEETESTEGVISANRPPDNPWDAFAQQTNKWDEDPEIARFLESYNKPRRAPVQVVHDSRKDSETKPGENPLPQRERRTSLKLTDFPTEIERPSLPVTPAPIRGPVIWGDEQEDRNKSVLPVAQGVPRQEEWVRRFTSQSLTHAPDPVLRDIGGVLHLICQHCGRQNPIVKLEELQRKQSLIMTGQENLQSKTPPRREMPESKTREEAIEAAMRAMSIPHQKLKSPAKPILKAPHFEVTEANDEELGRESLVSLSHMTATGSKSPTRFNPIVLEGEAASEGTSHDNTETLINDQETAQHHSSRSFDYSTSSLSPETSKVDLASEFAKDSAAEDLISPTQVV